MAQSIYLNDISSWFNNIKGYRYSTQNVASQCQIIVKNSSGRLFLSRSIKRPFRLSFCFKQEFARSVTSACKTGKTRHQLSTLRTKRCNESFNAYDVHVYMTNVTQWRNFRFVFNSWKTQHLYGKINFDEPYIQPKYSNNFGASYLAAERFMNFKCKIFI